MLLQWAKEQPNKPWLYQPANDTWKKYTFAECEAQVRGMATALRKLDLPPGSRIAISGRNTAHWFLADLAIAMRSEEHTSELQSLMRISYAVFCLKKKKQTRNSTQENNKHTSRLL